jgi:hypothetical protein
LWKINGVKANDGLITSAKYHCRAEKDDLWVATEGTWFFLEPKLTVPFADVIESMVIDWIKLESMVDDKNVIELRLAEQIASLSAVSITVPPWEPQTFTPEL